MYVTKDMAQKFANPETYKAPEQCAFIQKLEQHLEQTQERCFKQEGLPFLTVLCYTFTYSEGEKSCKKYS
jgi:hypothetical protein